MQELKDCLVRRATVTHITDLIIDCVQAQGSTLATFLTDDTSLATVTADMDEIVWDNFMEGKAPSFLSIAQDIDYSQSSSIFFIQVWRS